MLALMLTLFSLSLSDLLEKHGPNIDKVKNSASTIWIKSRAIHPCVHTILLHSCLTLCDPMDLALQAPLSIGILQASMLAWIVMPSSRGSSRPKDQTYVSCGSCIAGRFFATELPGKPPQAHLHERKKLDGTQRDWSKSGEVKTEGWRAEVGRDPRVWIPDVTLKAVRSRWKVLRKMRQTTLICVSERSLWIQ